MTATLAGAPLTGVTVIDLSRLLPGPLAAQILASLGARVIKVEEPRQGDPVRWAPPAVGSVGALASLLLAGVESVALDLKKPAGCTALLALLAEADVLLDTLRPGTLERLLGCTREQLQERFPSLVQCSLTGWGQDGPDAHRAGHDLTYQARAGTLAPTAGVSAQPVADIAGAWSAAAAVLAALVRRGRIENESPPLPVVTLESRAPVSVGERVPEGRGGEVAQEGGSRSEEGPAGGMSGAIIDASLYDATLHANLVGWAAEAAGPQPVGRRLPLSGALPCYDIYRTADGEYLAVALLEDHFWKRFCGALERRDLERPHPSEDPALRDELQRIFGAQDAEHWARWTAHHDLPAEVLRSAAAALEDSQQQARGVVRRVGEGLRLAFPARFDGQRPAAGDRVPDLGDDTTVVIEALASKGLDLPRWRRRAGVGRRASPRRWIAPWVLRWLTRRWRRRDPNP